MIASLRWSDIKILCLRVMCNKGVGGLLGDLQIVGDGMPADPAAWQDWMSCANTEPLTVSQAFECMKLFLKNYYERIHATEADGLLKSLGLRESNQQPSSTIWQTWERSIFDVLKKQS